MKNVNNEMLAKKLKIKNLKKNVIKNEFSKK